MLKLSIIYILWLFLENNRDKGGFKKDKKSERVGRKRDNKDDKSDGERVSKRERETSI